MRKFEEGVRFFISGLAAGVGMGMPFRFASEACFSEDLVNVSLGHGFGLGRTLHLVFEDDATHLKLDEPGFNVGDAVGLGKGRLP
jgi:hypothetical protein